MKLPFMLKFPWGEETHFLEKLWKMYIDNHSSIGEFTMYWSLANDYGISLPVYDNQVPKLHTIRPASERYKVGQFVQPFVWTYKPYKLNPNPNIPAQFDFMPPLEIISKQRFEIKYTTTKAFVIIDDKWLDEYEIEELAVNDGFKDAAHFFQYFNKSVENMEIRHFTNLKY